MYEGMSDGAISFHAGALIICALVKKVQEHRGLGNYGMQRQNRGKRVGRGLERVESSSGCFWTRKGFIGEK